VALHLLTCAAATCTATPTYALGTACAAARHPDVVRAIGAGATLFDQRWTKVGLGFGAAFKFKTEPRNPFALKSIVPDASALPPTEGFIAARTITCTFYEVNAPRAYVLRYVADGLRFNENNAGWTPPLPPVAVMVVLVSVTPGAQWVALDMPEARTAIPPFSVLRRLTEAEQAPTSAAIAPAVTVTSQRKK
jgi:hypothetical protein